MPRHCRGQSGFTMLEVMLAMTLGTLIAGVTTMGLFTVIKVTKQGTANLDSSSVVFLTSSKFAADVASVGPVPGVDQLITSGEPGCGGEPAVL